MTLIKPIEKQSTDSLLYLVEKINSISFSLGLLGGIFLGVLLTHESIEEQTKGILGAICVIGLLVFFFILNRYINKALIPEIKNRSIANVCKKP